MSLTNATFETKGSKKENPTKNWEAIYNRAYNAALYGGENNPNYALADFIATKAKKRGIELSIDENFGPSSMAAGLGAISQVTPKKRAASSEDVGLWLNIKQAEEQEAESDANLQQVQTAYNEWLADNDYGKLIDSINDLPPTISAEALGLMKSSIVARARQDETARQRRVAATLGLRGAAGGGNMGAMLAEMTAAEADMDISQNITNLELKKMEMDRQDELQKMTLLDQAMRAEQSIQGSYLGMIDQVQRGGYIPNWQAMFGQWGGYYAAVDAAREASNQSRTNSYFNLGGAFAGAAGDVGAAWAGAPRTKSGSDKYTSQFDPFQY